MDPSIQEYSKQIEFLLSVIIGLVGGFGSLFLTVVLFALGYHFKWKRRVDQKLEDDGGFQERMLGSLKEGTNLMTTHTSILKGHDAQFDKVEQVQQLQHIRLRELIIQHNSRHADKIEVPPLKPPSIFIEEEA